MSYNLKCPSCDAVQTPAKLRLTGNDLVACGRCRFSGVLRDWTRHANAPGSGCANPLPDGTYVAWGMKTKHGAGPGVLRGVMESSSGITPSPATQKGGTDYAKLTPGTSAARIYIAKDEVLLRGQYYAPPGAGGGAGAGMCVLLLNGSGGSIGHYMNSVVAGYQAWGAAVLAVDYRGIGKSTGSGTAHGLYSDAEAMLRYLTDDSALNGRGISASRVVLHGFSIGSAPATDLARNHSGAGSDRVGALVLHCPIASFGSAAAFKQGPGASPVLKQIVRKVASWGVGFNNDKKLLHIDLPVHVVYAVGDTFVDPQDAVRLAGVYRGVNTTIQGYRFGDHTDCDRIFNNAYNVAAQTTMALDQFVTGLPRA